MSATHTAPGLAILLTLAAVSQAQCQAPPEAAPLPPSAPTQAAPANAAPSAVTPPAPAFAAGDPVVDRTGDQVGAVQTLVETPEGPMVVVQIDGKLVSLLQTTLKMDGSTIVSSQTKAEMLAAAGAPN
jgi:hypothetical protein